MERVSGTHEVRVATLNLWGRHGAWDERRSVLVDGLRELQPDIIAFQEAVVTDGYDQVAELLGATYNVVHQAGREAGGTGLSIASRWEVREVWEETLRVTARVDPSEIAVAEILAPGPLGTLLFAHHNSSWQLGFEHERELQAVAASRLVEDLLGKQGESHVVLAGDFNAAPDSASVRFWRGLQSLGDTSVCYRDAWESAHPLDPGHTFSPRNPLVTGGNNWPLELGRRIDYVMVRCGDHGPTLDLTACERIFDKPVGSVWASDHFGVVANLAIPGPSPTEHH
ncbi:MAG: endonuclease/exonuclease/phosphatase family protein [Actinomycetota bacterium]|nr:endonuclease/exonuclease/phosphatase family protein [Actinomycetota bacterium]